MVHYSKIKFELYNCDLLSYVCLNKYLSVTYQHMVALLIIIFVRFEIYIVKLGKIKISPLTFYR